MTGARLEQDGAALIVTMGHPREPSEGCRRPPLASARPTITNNTSMDWMNVPFRSGKDGFPPAAFPRQSGRSPVVDDRRLARSLDGAAIARRVRRRRIGGSGSPAAGWRRFHRRCGPDRTTRRGRNRFKLLHIGPECRKCADARILHIDAKAQSRRNGHARLRNRWNRGPTRRCLARDGGGAGMRADLADLIWCLSMWVVPLAAIGLTELARRRRDLFTALDRRRETRSDPSIEMWSAAMGARRSR